jgi:hypothetical protein
VTLERALHGMVTLDPPRKHRQAARSAPAGHGLDGAGAEDILTLISTEGN